MVLDGPTITRELFRSILKEEMAKITAGIRPQADQRSNSKTAGDLLDVLVTSDRFPEFMTLLAYNYLK